MPYCIRCRHEYREGLTRCPECGGALTNGLLPAREGDRGEAAPPVAVWRSTSPLATALAQLQLERAGIPSASRAAEITLLVPGERAEEAQALLSSVHGEGPGSLLLSQISAVKLTCAECDRVRRVNLRKEEIPQLCSCGRNYDFGPALEVLQRLRSLVREVEDSDFDIELELESAEADESDGEAP